MKTIFTSILLICINIASFSQTKILFDATKAEMANNADWVIDADQFNIGYNPNAYIGGNEANPQQIPTPAQSGITSGTPQSYWKGALSAWAVDAVKLGYYVETLPYNGQITYGNSSNSQDLSNYDIYVVCEPNILFTSSEKKALMNFVQNGGGLFMISDHDNSDRNGDGYDSLAIWNDFMQNNSVQNNPFGITFDYEYFTEATTNIPNLASDPLLHGSYGDVTSVEFYGGTSMTLNTSQNSSVKGVVYRSGYSNTGTTGVLCAYATYGQGKVVALGDSSPADDGTGDTGDDLYDGWIQDANGNHERLIMNATIWLATNTTNVEYVDNISEKVFFSSNGQTGNIMIKNPTDNKTYRIDIFDTTGRKIISKNNISANTNIEVSLPANGIFLYRISNKQNVIQSGKLVF